LGEGNFQNGSTGQKPYPNCPWTTRSCSLFSNTMDAAGADIYPA
jgi:hypothetical protein